MTLKKRPRKTPAGLTVVSIVHAINHDKYFVIAKKPHGTEYVVETLRKDGSHAKRQIRDLWDATFDRRSDARYAIRQWDFK